MKGAMRRLRTKSVAANRTPGRSFFRKDPMPANILFYFNFESRIILEDYEDLIF
jgi:hypothetical protein